MTGPDPFAYDKFAVNGRTKVLADGEQQALAAIADTLAAKGATSADWTWTSPLGAGTFRDGIPIGVTATWTCTATWSDGTTSSASCTPSPHALTAMVVAGAEVLRQRGVTVTIATNPPPPARSHLGRELTGPSAHDLVCGAVADDDENTPICGQPAITHVLIEENADGFGTAFACETHTREVIADGFTRYHPTRGSACGLPGSVWIPWMPSRCDLDTTDRKGTRSS